MKLRSVIPAFASLFLAGLLANAAQAPQAFPPTTSMNDPVALAIFAPESPGCPETLTETTPKAVEKSSHPICGSCSVTICQGAEEETVCGFRNGEFYYCRPTGPLCGGAPVTFRCTCTNGIIP